VCAWSAAKLIRGRASQASPVLQAKVGQAKPCEPKGKLLTLGTAPHGAAAQELKPQGSAPMHLLHAAHLHAACGGVRAQCRPRSECMQPRG